MYLVLKKKKIISICHIKKMVGGGRIPERGAEFQRKEADQQKHRGV